MLNRFSRVRLCDAVDCSLSMGFSRQEYWSGLPCLPPGDLPDLGIKPSSLVSPALASGFFTTSASWEDRKSTILQIFFNEKNYLKIQRCLKTYSGKYLSPVTLGNHCIHVSCILFGYFLYIQANTKSSFTPRFPSPWYRKVSCTTRPFQ